MPATEEKTSQLASTLSPALPISVCVGGAGIKDLERSDPTVSLLNLGETGCLVH